MSEAEHVVQQSIEERIAAAVSQDPMPSAEDSTVDRINAINAPEEVHEEIAEDPQIEESQEGVEATDESDESTETDEEYDGEETVLESLGDLAGHLGVDVAELYNISIPITTADGARKEVTLGAWKDSYQLSEQAAAAQKQAQEEYEALNTKIREIEEFHEQQAYTTQTIIQAAQAELTQDFNAINWDQLRVEDPSRYAVTRQDFIERNARLQQMGQAAAQSWEENKQKISEQRQSQIGQFVQREQRALADAIPEWRNEEAAAAEKAKIADHLLSLGYRKEDLDQLYDHRIVVLARESMLLREQRKKTDAAKKKVVKVGKTVLKPGARRSKATNKANRERELRAAMRKGGGKVEDAAAIIQSRLGR